jgi:hypothetical protein
VTLLGSTDKLLSCLEGKDGTVMTETGSTSPSSK